MAVLREYGVVRTDHCLRFQFPSGRVDGKSFPTDGPSPTLPQHHGCYSGEVFAVSAECEQVFDAYESEVQANYQLKDDKRRQFLDFVMASRTVEDVLEVIDLPADIRERLGASLGRSDRGFGGVGFRIARNLQDCSLRKPTSGRAATPAP